MANNFIVKNGLGANVSMRSSEDQDGNQTGHHNIDIIAPGASVDIGNVNEAAWPGVGPGSLISIGKAEVLALNAGSTANVAVQAANTAAQVNQLQAFIANTSAQVANTGVLLSNNNVQVANVAAQVVILNTTTANVAVQTANVASREANTAAQVAVVAVHTANTALQTSNTAAQVANAAVQIANVSVILGGVGIPAANTIAARISGLANTISLSTGNNVVGKFQMVDAANAAIDWNSPALIAGNTASGATLTAPPVTVGGKALVSLPAAVANNQVVNDFNDKDGRKVITLGLRELTGRARLTLGANTSEQDLLAAGGAGIFRDATRITISNSNTTVNTVITIRDAPFADNTAVAFVWTVPAVCPPIGISGGYAKQMVAAKKWTAQSSVACTGVEITIEYEERH